MSRFVRRSVTTAFLAAGVITLAACSSSSSTSAAGSGGATPSGGSATGSPVRVLGMAPVNSPAGSVPGVLAGLKAAARSINAAGGINGHPIQIDWCNTQGDPNQEVTCAKQGVTNQDVALLSGYFFTNPDGVLNTLKAANIASLGGPATSPQELVNPISFPLEPGQFSSEACTQIVKIGAASKVATIATDIASIKANAENAASALAKQNVPFAGSFTLPPTAPDATPVVQQAANAGANGLLVYALPNQVTQVIQASASVGDKVSTCTSDGIIFGSQLQALGAAASNYYVAATMPPLSAAATNPAVAAFIKDMKAEEASGDADASIALDKYSSVDMRAWAAMQAFAQVAKTVSDPITAASFLAALNKADNVTTGIFPPVNFTKSLGGTQFPRLFNVHTLLLKWNPSSLQFEPTAVTDYIVPEATS